MPALTIIEDDLAGVQIAALLRLHIDDMHQWSPPGAAHVLPAERLRQDDVTFYSAWDGEQLAGFGALKQLTADHGEIKSMRAAPDYRGQGVGRALLLHLLAQAKTRGYTHVSLETARTEPFRPAVSLYEAHGFVECPPFANYVLDGFSICMTKRL